MLSLANMKLWAIGAAIALALIGVAVWRIFSAGKDAEKIKAVEGALENIRRAAEARNKERREPTDASKDEFNRDNWGTGR